MNDEECLRQLARQAIGAERIPAGSPTGTWGGNGTGALCDICGLAIPDDEIEFEVEFSDHPGPSGSCCHLHSRCFAAWEFERQTLDPGEHHKRSNGHGMQSLPATEAQGLPGGDKEGSMPDGEGNSETEGGSA